MSFQGSPVQRWYEVAPVDVVGMRSLLHPEVVFTICAGWPNGGTFHGPDAVLNDFFPASARAWESLKPNFDEVLEDDERFAVRGHYDGVAAPSGVAFALDFVHIWKLRDGMLASLHQIADTAVLSAARDGKGGQQE